MSSTRRTVTHGGESVMLWGCKAWDGVGKLEFIDETMNTDLYNNILKRNLKSSAKKHRLGNSFLFQQDNYLKHAAKKLKPFLMKMAFTEPRFESNRAFMDFIR